MKYISLVVALLVLTACSKTEEEKHNEALSSFIKKVTLYREYNEEERTFIAQVLDGITRTHCKGLLRYQKSYEELEIRYLTSEAMPMWAENRHNWQKAILIKPKIKKRPQIGVADAAGHTLYIYAGQGDVDGIHAAKTLDTNICKLPIGGKFIRTALF